MTMNPLPPQAYTKETMLKAYQWLMVQNSNIKELATTPDILVSLYLKATRDGDSALDRPSIQNFKNELKSLSGMLGELEKPSQEKEIKLPAQAMSSFTAPVNSSPSGPLNPSTSSSPPEKNQKNNMEVSDNFKALDALDASSREMIQEVKADFNLSSEMEALRLLIKVGYTKSKNLLK